MTEEELQAIRCLSDRMIAAINDDGREANGMSMAAFIEQYVPKLLAEVERLRTELIALGDRYERVEGDWEAGNALIRSLRDGHAAMRENAQDVAKELGYLASALDIDMPSDSSYVGIVQALARQLLDK